MVIRVGLHVGRVVAAFSPTSLPEGTISTGLARTVVRPCARTLLSRRRQSLGIPKVNASGLTFLAPSLTRHSFRVRPRNALEVAAAVTI